MSESIRLQYAVYLLPTHASGNLTVPALLHNAMPRHSDLTLVEEIPKQPQGMLLHRYLQKDVKRNYAPPDIKSLQYFGRGLTDQQAQALQNSTSALILQFAHPKKNVWSALRAANELVEEVARKSGGLVWDEETREVFSPDAWHEKRLSSWTTEVPDVSTQITIHIYPNGEYARAITLGMSKMGLPDVVIQESAWSSDSQVGNLINVFCQSIAEGENLPAAHKFRLDLHTIRNDKAREGQIQALKPNAAGVACLSLAEGKWEDGDPKNRLIRLASDEYAGNDPHAKQDSLLSSFFGWEDSMIKVHHNEELLAASAKAKAKLPELRRVFSEGLEPGEFIELKAPFSAENGDREWMWVEVTDWNGNEIKGLLENDPSEVTTMRAGQIVQVREEDVFDYIHQFADKRTEGNTTGEIIRKMSEGEVPHAASATVPSCPKD